MWADIAIVVVILAIVVAAVGTARERHEIDLTRRIGDD